MEISGWGLDPYGKRHIFTREVYDDVSPVIIEICFVEYVVWEPPFDHAISPEHDRFLGYRSELPAWFPIFNSLEEVIPFLEKLGKRVVKAQRQRGMSALREDTLGHEPGP